MEWNGIEWNGMEWDVMEWNGVNRQCDQVVELGILYSMSSSLILWIIHNCLHSLNY